jgi:DNA-directed RNA polymerase subunit M/transcription elongation factor TFIIS
MAEWNRCPNCGQFMWEDIWHWLTCNRCGYQMKKDKRRKRKNFMGKMMDVIDSMEK